MQWNVKLTDTEGAEIDAVVEAETKAEARAAILGYYPSATLSRLEVPPEPPTPPYEPPPVEDALLADSVEQSLEGGDD